MSGLADLNMPTTVLGNPGYTGVSTARRPAAQADKMASMDGAREGKENLN
jgi:hypothetical protein